MKLIIVLSVVSLFCTLSPSCDAHDLIVGNSYNGRMIWQQKVEYLGIPFKKRVKELFYSDPSQHIIKGLVVRETSQTEAVATVTAGGVGFSFVNLRFKSERGSGLYYIAEIYV